MGITVGCSTVRKIFKNKGISPEQKKMIDEDQMTNTLVMKEVQITTDIKELMNCSTNTDKNDYIDASAAGTIAQNCAYFIHQEKELENEISKRDKIKKNQQLFSKCFEDTLSEEKRNILENMKDKYLNFNNWNVDKADNKCIVYSSKTPIELLECKDDFNMKDKKLKEEHDYEDKNQYQSLVLQLLDQQFSNNVNIGVNV